MSTLQTLDRGLRALDIISRSPEGISVAELAAELGVHRAICYRIVATLESHSLVTRTESGRLRLGVGAAVLLSRFEPQFLHGARPVLAELADRTRATAFVAGAEGDECVVLMVAEPTDTVLRVGYRVGSRHPLDRGASGIAILALRPPSPHDSEAVRQARRDGYSITSGQLERGAVGVSAGIRASGHPLERSVGVVATEGLDTEKAAEAVLDAARRLARLVTT
ncbi:IclR family transcriptional regulator [Saccharomonospora glauca]|jgi:DNA-binding IclR family transcriptional regulator|uniref:Transcriptional regulator n=1 Tax=Saccharomonospora glauca K62 TaxID=928724 RepID=I1CYE8_9PSEU|nr:helix-turn-helix domain-containing protein [Saccharomonospora glauca]EIE97722.1 transcriptional regulator [Saccharomonospora glauca K62]